MRFSAITPCHRRPNKANLTSSTSGGTALHRVARAMLWWHRTVAEGPQVRVRLGVQVLHRLRMLSVRDREAHINFLDILKLAHVRVNQASDQLLRFGQLFRHGGEQCPEGRSISDVLGVDILQNKVLQVFCHPLTPAVV